ncbi:MAG: putative DNA binding domain-containing protein [Candidatus Magnetoovum sp. WYHC-5]|nr:putative DNA binding domain-containing protein [Candidatus Magnetoovum sp. WYHC-5]
MFYEKLLTANEVEKIIKKGEGISTEFKLKFTTDPIRETIAAFANDYGEVGGGIIIIGVEPTNNSIVGVEGNRDNIQQRISGICRDVMVPALAPRIYDVEVNGKYLIVIDVNKSHNRPHRSNGFCYIRIGSATIRATPDEEFELIRRSGRLPYDLLQIRDATVDDLNFDKFEKKILSKRLSAETLSLNGRSIIQWAEHLKFLIREGDKLIPTVTAVLLFGTTQRFIPHSAIDFIRFEGLDKSCPIKDRKEITGNIDDMIFKADELVRAFMIQGYSFSKDTPKRTDIYEYPFRAVREAVANALIHRNYETSNALVSLEMFDDRLEITSPGSLYGIVTRENFGTGINDYRNPTIAVNLYSLEIIEKAGTGIPLIRRQMKDNGSSDPTFEIGDTYLKVKLPAHPYYVGRRFYERGLVLLEQGKRDEARDLFLKSIELASHLAQSWGALGRLEALYGNIESAEEAFKRAIKEDPHYEKAYLEWAKFADLQGSTSRSQEIYNQATKAIPDSATLWYAWASLERKLKNWEKAIGFLQKAISLKSDDPNMLRTLGNTAFQIGKFGLAIESLEKALANTSNDKEKGPIYLDMMRVFIERKAPYEQIRDCFYNARSVDFKAHELFYAYHKYLTTINKHAEALEVLSFAAKEGINIEPSFPEVYISNLPNKLPRQKLITEIEKLFTTIGIGVIKVSIYPNKISGLVRVITELDVQNAISKLNKTMFMGQEITINRKKTQKDMKTKTTPQQKYSRK